MDFEFSGFIEALGDLNLIVEGLHNVNGVIYETEIGAAWREMGERR